MTKEKLNYSDAYEELLAIIEDIENGDISVDVLSEKVKREVFNAITDCSDTSKVDLKL